jgi:hypothetical protein
VYIGLYPGWFSIISLNLLMYRISAVSDFFAWFISKFTLGGVSVHGGTYGLVSTIVWSS